MGQPDSPVRVVQALPQTAILNKAEAPAGSAPFKAPARRRLRQAGSANVCAAETWVGEGNCLHWDSHVEYDGLQNDACFINGVGGELNVQSEPGEDGGRTRQHAPLLSTWERKSDDLPEAVAGFGGHSHRPDVHQVSVRAPILIWRGARSSI